MQNKNIVSIIFIDRDRVILKTISSSEIISVDRRVLEFAIDRRLPDCVEGAEDVLLDYTGEWMGNKLYKSTCRLEDVA